MTETYTGQLKHSTKGKWNPEEHSMFLEAVEIWGKQWKLISKHVKTRTPSQCRSHAQKHFIKLEMCKRMLRPMSPQRIVEEVEFTKPVSGISHYQIELSGKYSRGDQYGEDIVFLYE